MAASTQRQGAPPNLTSSQTQLATPSLSQTQTETQIQPAAILRLRGGHNPTGRSVQWSEDVVDNEGLGRKKSKGKPAFPDTDGHAPDNNVERSTLTSQCAAYTTSPKASTNLVTSRRRTRAARHQIPNPTAEVHHRRLLGNSAPEAEGREGRTGRNRPTTVIITVTATTETAPGDRDREMEAGGGGQVRMLMKRCPSTSPKIRLMEMVVHNRVANLLAESASVHGSCVVRKLAITGCPSCFCVRCRRSRGRVDDR
jgi:protein phosphatase 1 regulatory subunit 11